jgi:multiple sugar transport system substrate-binding protein
MRLTSPINRRSILAGAALAAAALAAAPGTAAAWTLEEAAKPYAGTTIRIIGEALAPLESLNQQKAAFEEATGIKVEVEQHAFDQVIQKTTADFVGRTGYYDAILNPHVRVPTLIANGWIQPLDAYLSNADLADPGFDVESTVLSKDWLMAALGQEGKLYGVPFSGHTIYLNWRYDLFEHPDEQAAFMAKYGYDLPSPPLTLQHLWDTAEFFTRKAGATLAGETLQQDVYGIALSGKRHISMLWNFYNVLYAFDGRVVDSMTGPDYGPVVINSRAGVDALTYYKDILNKYGPPGSLNYTWDEQLAAMQSGLAVQALLWADASYAISHDPSQSQVVDKVAYSGTPVGARKIVNLHQWGMFLPTTSKNPEAAWLFLQWTQRPDVQAKLMSTGSISLTKSAYQEPSVQDLVYAATNYFLLSGEVPEMKGGPAYRKAGSPWGLPQPYAGTPDPVTGESRPVIFKLENFPEYATVEEILMKNLSAVLAGQMSPQAGLDESVAEIYAEVPALAEHKP